LRQYAFITLLLAAGATATVPAVAGWSYALDYDAQFVRMKVPDRVAAHEVFPVAITVRNTGTKTWEEWPIRLRSVHPQNNLTWGTSYILIAQGTAVQPGDEYTFRSYLRAPADEGKLRFQWQVCKERTTWFGETTPVRTIQVASRPSGAPTTTKRPRQISEGRKVLSFDDFDYVGSFKPPKTVGNARGAYSESGLALRPTAKGRDRLLMNYTHPTQVLFEIEIPQLVKVEAGEHRGLKTAKIEKIWGPLKIPKHGEQAIFPNGGFAWMEETQTLIWTWYHGYKTGDPPPILGATRLSGTGELAFTGPWKVSTPSGLYKSYWGGVIVLPQAFAKQYTGGKRLALGFGGYYSICAPASRGPALGAIPDPVPTQTSVPVTAMLCYPHDTPAPRDGDYFNANCGFWSEQPAGPNHGTWTYDDWCRAGAFVDTSSGHAYVAFVRLGTGRMGYDFGTITSANSSQYWYFYDPSDLGKAARGEKQPSLTSPDSMTRVNYPLGQTVTGACFDAKTRRLYLCVTWAYPEGLESYPVMHVYRVR
jgi:hypothetical protein